MNQPFISEVKTSLLPIEIFEIFHQDSHVVFLDSSKKEGNLSQYSYIGLDPFLTMHYYLGVCQVNGIKINSNPFDWLKENLEKYAIKNNTGLPFIGGGIGFFSYDLARELETLPCLSEMNVEMPSCYFNFYNAVIIFDHQNQKVFLSVLGEPEVQEKQAKDILFRIDGGKKLKEPQLNHQPMEFSSRFSQMEYEQTVERMRQYIRNGDIYIANMTHTFYAKKKKNPYQTYKVLRRVNPSPFGAFLQTEDFAILSSSPERFLKIQDGTVTTRPIKGTRRRGETTEEDERLKLELQNSEKDKSELLMIVDLERNDLSKVCLPHSIQVTELFQIESYQTVHHLVASIEGKLDPSLTAVDCMKACFPGGSITGAPKVRAMEIIEELEKTRRNIYTGCLGFFGFDGNADFNIIIRTILMKNDEIFVGVGGGITWESECEAEYIETLDKAKALFKSLQYEEVED